MLHIIRERRQRQEGQPESDKRGPRDVHAMSSNTGCQLHTKIKRPDTPTAGLLFISIAAFCYCNALKAAKGLLAQLLVSSTAYLDLY